MSEEGTLEAESRQSAGQRADTQATGPPTWTSTSDTTAGGTASTSEMPYDCLSNILEHFTDAYGLLLCTRVSRPFRDAATSDYLWCLMCVRHERGVHLDLTERLGRFVWPDVQQLRRVDDQTMRAQATGQGTANKSWLEIFKRSTNSLKSTICIDTGRGSAKYARADDWRPDHINLGAYGLVPTSLEASHRIDLLLELVLGRLQ